MISFTLPMPPSANRYWRRGGNSTYVSDEAQEYKDAVSRQVSAVGKREGGKRVGPLEPLAGEIAVTVRVYRARRSGDLDNRLKVLLDSLQGVAYVSDSQIVEIHAERFEDKSDPRVEVEIVERVKAEG